MSSGAKRDLLVLFLCKALLEIALDKDASEDSIQRDRTNKHYKLNKKLDSRLNKLYSMLNDTLNKAITKEIAKWLKSKTDFKIYNMLIKIQETEIQLEVLAMYVMYVNFCERDKRLDDIFQAYTDSSLYFDNIDLIVHSTCLAPA